MKMITVHTEGVTNVDVVELSHYFHGSLRPWVNCSKGNIDKDLVAFSVDAKFEVSSREIGCLEYTNMA